VFEKAFEGVFWGFREGVGVFKRRLKGLFEEYSEGYLRSIWKSIWKDV
jgi:hypothetical protein